MLRVPDDDDLYIETSALKLSPVFRSDTPSLYELLKEPRLYLFTADRPLGSPEELGQRIEGWERRLSPDGRELWLNWTIRERNTSAVVGYVQASVSESVAELAWVVGVPYQSHGIATEAARAVVGWISSRFAVGLKANIHPNHTASQSVAQKLGLKATSDVSPEGEIVWRRPVELKEEHP